MSQPHTLLLGQDEIRRTMSAADYIDAVEQAFRALGEGRMEMPPVVHMAAENGAFHVKSAAYTGDPAYVAVKVNGNFPRNFEVAGLPTIQGAIVLCDGSNGRLLAILDSIEVTAMRTAAATAVAAKYLASGTASTAAIIGCGIQGRVQLLALNEVLPLQKVYVFDTDASRRNEFARRAAADTGLEVVQLDHYAAGTSASEVVVTCTSSRSPFLGNNDVAPGTFIAAVGADNDDKQELHPDLLAESVVVTDHTGQCAEIGELHHALVAGVMTRNDVAAELSEIVIGTRKPRTSRDDIVIFDSTGMAIQDVAAAGMIYERALANGYGTSIAFA